MKIQVAFEDITSWEKFVSSHKTSLEEEITQKTKKKTKKNALKV